MSALSAVKLNPVAKQVGLAEEKHLNKLESQQKLHYKQVTSNHLSYTAVILMNLSKYTEITSLLYLVLLKEKTDQKKERRKKNKGSLDRELKKTPLPKVRTQYSTYKCEKFKAC